MARTTPIVPLFAAAALVFTGGAHAMDDTALAAIVDKRLTGDRTGACMAVAVIGDGGVARAYRCADPAQAARIGPDRAFEIGSVAKTMTSTLLADLVLQGKASLDDPLSAYLPDGTVVPDFEGQPILLRHVVTHTSGLPALPSRMRMLNPADPYAALTTDELLASLADVQLAQAPGTRFEYSNFASMLLSYAVARRAGTDFESLLRERLSIPLGMAGAYITTPPDGVRAAGGHGPGGLPVPAWTLPPDLAGAGGVRATLDDMVHYVQANLAPPEAPPGPAIELAQRQVSKEPPMAMNWMRVPVGERTVLAHEGGTGGFSSFVSVDREAGRGVVVLSDTSWNAIGGLGSLALHLVDDALPLGAPRVVATPPQSLLDGLVGEYRLQGTMRISLRQRDGRLFAQAEGQPEFELAYDSEGDFYPGVVDALLKPQRKADGSYAFTWTQGGGTLPATRVVDPGTAAPRPAPDAAALAGYAGEYALMPGFALTVRVRDGRLFAQATGQGEFPLDSTGEDRFEAAAYGIEIVFKRNPDGEVASLDLHQGGGVMSGARK